MDPLQMDAIRYNKELDESLEKDGNISEELYFKLLEAYRYDAASTVGWVEAKLKVLRRRLSAGQPLYLFNATTKSQTVVVTLEIYETWVETNFPGVRIK